MESLHRTFLALAALALSAPVHAVDAEQRLEGIVLGTTATYCEASKSGGCTGTLTLKAAGGKRVIKVPLGAPVSAGCEAVPLHRLQGRRVIVTEADEASGPVVRAVSAADEEGAC